MYYTMFSCIYMLIQILSRSLSLSDSHSLSHTHIYTHTSLSHTQCVLHGSWVMNIKSLLSFDIYIHARSIKRG